MHKIEKRKIPSCKEQKLLMPFLRKVLDDPNTEIRADVINEGVELLHRYFPFKMHDFQLFRFAILYGLFRKDNGFPVFRQSFNMWGRGTGKNGIAAMDAFYLSTSSGSNNYHVDIVANSEKQAKVSFRILYNLIKDNQKLDRMFNRTKELITYGKTNSEIGYLTSNAGTKDGGQQGAIIFDEVHEYENRDIIDVLIGGLGKTDIPGRVIYLTTDGDVREAVIDELKEKSRQILEGERSHNGFLPIIFKLDNLTEVGKPELFVKAIPRLPYSAVLEDQVMSEYDDIDISSEAKEAFITKRMNLAYVSKEKSVASWEDVLATKDHVWPDFTGSECIGSVDYAELRDFASVGLHFKKDGKHYFKQHSFIHEESLKLTDYNVNVQESVEQGFATIVRGVPIIPTDMIAEWFVEQAKTFYIKKVYTDRFRFVPLKDSFEKIGLELDDIPNGYISHTKLEPIIARMFAEHTLVFEDDKMMRWYAWNVKVETDKKGNRSYLKINPEKRKTDGWFSFLHGLYGTEINGDLKEVPFQSFDMSSW